MDPKTDTDRYVIEQVAPLLQPGERIAVCAYLVPPIEGGRIGIFIDAATKLAAFAAVTEARLILVETRIGAFGPLHENRGVRSIPRERIKGVFAGERLLIELIDGGMLEYQDNRTARHVSTQREFFERLESLYGRSPRAIARAQHERLWRAIGLFAGLIIAAVYLYLRLRR